ncbi:hypothetical protein [Desertimonas flava]|nr:hypothetical protein [Desertimonas flava]
MQLADARCFEERLRRTVRRSGRSSSLRSTIVRASSLVLAGGGDR